MSEAGTIREVTECFADGDTCLEHILHTRYGPTLYCPSCRADKSANSIKIGRCDGYRCCLQFLLEEGYCTVNHSAGEYVRGSMLTNTIERFWGNVKRGIECTYIHVSHYYRQTNLWEFEFRRNLRMSPHLTFELLVQAFPRPAPTPSPKEDGQSAA